jgi:hypothetical protein
MLRITRGASVTLLFAYAVAGQPAEKGVDDRRLLITAPQAPETVAPGPEASGPPPWWHEETPTPDAGTTGDRLEGIPHGRGTLRLANGDVYTGDLREGLYHGHGDYRWADGHRYVGRYAEGLKSGRGLYLLSDGSFHDGDWRDGRPVAGWNAVFFNGEPYAARSRDGRFVLTGRVVPAGGLPEGMLSDSVATVGAAPRR